MTGAGWAVIQAYVDGGFFRELGIAAGKPFPLPWNVCANVVNTAEFARWLDSPGSSLHRVNYYDALPAEGEPQDPSLEAYWNAIELMDGTCLGWGYVRRVRRRQQKAVDSLLSVEMLAGAVDDSFDVALLVASDGDYVPVMEEVRRRGKRAVLVAREKGLPGLSPELRRNCDLFMEIEDRWLISAQMAT